MPAHRSFGASIQTGTQTVVSFGSSHEIRNFAAQTDQTLITKWMDPNGYKSTLPQPQRRTVTLDHKAHDDGFYTWRWVFDYWTLDMYDHWKDTFLSGVSSAVVTVKLFDIDDVAWYLTAVMHEPRYQELVYQMGGFQDVPFLFVKGETIT